MKNFNLHTLVALVALGTTTVALGNTPSIPVDLQSSVDGTKVELSWKRNAEEGIVASADFESDVFPGEGWEVKTYNASDYRCSWFHYPTDDFKELDDWDYYINNGEGSTMVFMDMGWPHEDGTPANQDEWLISPILDNAVYLDFWCYINPMILEYAQFEDFVDQYCVKISHDGGDTWETLWDARYDHNGFDSWQQVSLYLGEPQPNTRIAFHAQSEMTQEWSSLYFSWTLDDIYISSNSTASAEVQMKSRNTQRNISDGMQMYRNFIGSERTQSSATALKRSKALAAATEYYQVYLNGELLADNINSLNYTDISDKDPGEYVYDVYAVNATGKSEAASVTVTIKEVTCNAPTNVKVTSTYDEESGYGDVIITWDAPEGERVPVCYCVYVDGILAGIELPLGEMGNSDVTRGAYIYEVTAVYDYPFGESERVGEQVALGTRYTPTGLNASYDINNYNVTLDWQAAKASEWEIEAYKVFRGNTEIATIQPNEPLTYTDKDIVSGTHTYSVKALYSDDVLSLPCQANVIAYDYEIMPLPYTQHFDGDLTPDNWLSSAMNEATPPNYNWRFDNWYQIKSPCNEVEGNFASVSSEDNYIINIWTGLATPIFDCSTISATDSVILSCTMDYCTYWDSSFPYIEVSLDGGDYWEWYNDIYVDDVVDYTYTLDVTDVARGNTPCFRFVYDGCGDGYLLIDNFKIESVDNSAVKNITNNTPDIRVTPQMLYVTTPGEKIESIEIYTTNGCLVYASHNINSDAYNITLDNWNKGLYIVKVETSSENVCKKFSVN